MEGLPTEIVQHIIAYLKPVEVAALRATSQHLHRITSDPQIWRDICFQRSDREKKFQQQAGDQVQTSLPFQAHPHIQAFRHRTQTALSAHQAWINAQAAASANGDLDEAEANESQSAPIPTRRNTAEARDYERARRLANWDPSYQNEQIDWYAEYIARHGPLSKCWFQPARAENSRPDDLPLDPRGLALLDRDYVVAPLEDDSIAIWDLKQDDVGKMGHLLHQSRTRLLATSTNGTASINPTIASAIAVDSFQKRAFVVAQDHLQEVDLQTLQVSATQQFPTKIAALSNYNEGVPLTVGTRSAVHLFDPRTQARAVDPAETTQVDRISTYPSIPSREGAFAVFRSGNTDRFASLHQAGPTAIQHLYNSEVTSMTGDIVVSGRFPSLLVYDRRNFPKLKTTLYSGAQLCGLAALPYAYSALDAEIMREGEMPIIAAQEAKAHPGHTLFACGEYNGRGALEIFGLSDDHSGHLQASTFKNRVSAARFKMLSIANHGARLVTSDAEGGIRWLERDGQTLIRRWNINEPLRKGDGTRYDLTHSNDEAVLKLVPIPLPASSKSYQDGLLAWTGDRIGLLSFSHEPRFGGPSGSDWGEMLEDEVEGIKRREERIYGETMRRALARQADEVRWMSGLGLQG